MLATATAACAPETAVDPGKEPPPAYSLDREFLLEADRPLAQAEVAGREDFQPLRRFDRNSTRPLWLRLRLHNPRTETASLYLVLDNAHLDRVEFFAPAATGFRKLTTGDTLPFARRPIEYREFVFPIEAAAGTSVYYLRIETAGLYRPGLRLWRRAAFLEQAGREKLLFGGFFGGLVLVGLYHLLLFLSTHQGRYFLYCYWLAAVGLLLFNYEGFAFQWLWPRLPQLTGASNAILLGLAVMAGPLFARSFLRTKRHAIWIDRLLLSVVLAGLLGLALAFANPLLSIRFNVAVAVSSVLLVLVAGPVSFLRGFQPARFYILGNLLLLIATLLMILTLFGPLPETPLSRYGVYAGVTLDCLLIALALADEINVVNRKLRLSEASRDYMQDILYSLKECVLVIRPDEIIRTCNPASRTLIGYAPDELEGRSIGDFFASPSPFRTGDNVDWRFEDIRRVPLLLRSRGGEKVAVLFSSSVMRDAAGRVEGIICLAQKAENGPRIPGAASTPEGAGTANEESANGGDAPPSAHTIDDSIAWEMDRIDLSRKMRTPVHVILGMSRLLEAANLDANQRRYLALLRQAGESLLNIGDRLVGAADEGPGDETLFHLEDLLDSLAELLALEAHEKGLEFSIYIEPNVDLNLKGDAVHLRLLLVHLLGEALRRTNSGSVVLAVSLAGRKAREILLRFAFRRLPGDVTPGRGSFPGRNEIDPLLASLGGAVEDGETDARNEMTLTIPFEWTLAGGWHREGARPSQPGDTRILLADEADAPRAAVREYLRGAGAFVNETRTLEDTLAALATAERENRPFDFALVDARLLRNPGGEALSAKLAPLQEHSNLRLLVMLMLNDPEQLAGSETRARYLIKPIKRRELIQKLDLAEPAPIAPGDANGERPLRILLAEDNPDSQLLFQAFVGKAHLVDVADNGEEAVHLYKSGAYDIVFMDMQMPVMDGFTAVFKIRKWEEERGQGPRIPIYALTAFSLRDDIERSLRVGCTGHIAKPVSRETILDLLNDLH